MASPILNGCACRRTARFCNSGAHGGQICVSWEVVEQLLKDWGQLPSPIEPNLVAMAPVAITANYMQSVLSRQKAILDAITLRTTGCESTHTRPTHFSLPVWLVLTNQKD